MDQHNIKHTQQNYSSERIREETIYNVVHFLQFENNWFFKKIKPWESGLHLKPCDMKNILNAARCVCVLCRQVHRKMKELAHAASWRGLTVTVRWTPEDMCLLRERIACIIYVIYLCHFCSLTSLKEKKFNEPVSENRINGRPTGWKGIKPWEEEGRRKGRAWVLHINRKEVRNL